MKRSFTKLIAGFILATVLVASNPVDANAYSTTNNGKGFKKAWELSVTCDSNKGVLTYGYNTFAINEDYAHAYHSSKKHYAYVKNGKGSFSGSNKSKGKWSKIEVTHKGTTITYGNSY